VVGQSRDLRARIYEWTARGKGQVQWAYGVCGPAGSDGAFGCEFVAFAEVDCCLCLLNMDGTGRRRIIEGLLKLDKEVICGSSYTVRFRQIGATISLIRSRSHHITIPRGD
jgi:hypothetical protein